MGGLLPLLGMVAAAVLVRDCSPQQIQPCDSDKINFLSFFPCTGSEPQRTPHECDVFLYPAAQLAVEHINQHPRMLKYQPFNNTLTLIPTGTRGDVHFTTFFHAKHVAPKLPLIHGIIGPDDSIIAERTAYISGNYFQTHMISYGARDPSLSDRERYPLFYRSLPSGQFLNAGIVVLLKMFGWKRIAMLASVEEQFHTKTADQLAQLTLEQPLELRVEFIGNIGDNLHFAFNEILAADLRVIIGLFSQEAARRVLCEANRFNSSLTDPSHVWVLLSYYDPDWWRLSEEELGRLHPSQGNCSNQEMADLLESVLFLDSFNYNSASNEHDPSNLTLQNFHEQLLNWTVATHPSLENSSNLTAYLLHSHATAAYDAVWSLAVAWNMTTPRLVFEEGICNMTNLLQVATTTASVLSESLHATRLGGIAGPQLFNVSRDSYGQILISQFINGSTQPVGIFQPASGGSGALEQFVYLHDTRPAGLDFIQPALGFQWKGRPDNTPPSDGVAVEHSRITLPALGVVTVLVVLAMAFSVALLLLNIYYRENRHIKASSPRLNILIIAGFMLVPPSAVLRGLIHSREYYGISVSAATALCQVELHVTNTALTVAVATLFAKNWRIYRIFHNQRMQMLSWMLSDNGLLLMVLLVTLPFVSLLVVWQIVDPVVSCQQTFVSATRVLKLSCCGSESYLVWLWLCIGYTALMMVALLVVSFHNSTTASQFMEEGNSTAKFAMLHLLLVLPALLLTVVILELESSLYTFSFWLSVVWLVILPVTLLTILYVPKFVCVYKDHRSQRRQTVEERRTTVMRTRLSSLREESSKLKLELEERQSRVRLLSQSYSESHHHHSP